MNKLVVGPFFGELGWELFSWQPYIRGLFLHNQHPSCVVYGKKGRGYLYDSFAEYREIKIPFKEESECNFIHNFEQHKPEVDKIFSTIIERHKSEDENFQFSWFNNLKRLNDPMYMMGRPNLIEKHKQHPQVQDATKEKPKNVCLCIRNRELSDFRNWEFENWYELADRLKKICNVYIVGKIEEDGWEVPEGVVDLTNQTSINDCIDIFGDMDLIVGGSTGLMHLASRMGKPHFVWGVPKNKVRYAETNWFGAKYKVYTDRSWMPEVEDIYPQVESFVLKGEFNV